MGKFAVIYSGALRQGVKIPAESSCRIENFLRVLKNFKKG